MDVFCGPVAQPGRASEAAEHKTYRLLMKLLPRLEETRGSGFKVGSKPPMRVRLKRREIPVGPA